MPFDALEIRVSLQKLLIGPILVIVPLSFVGGASAFLAYFVAVTRG
jgi:hypothetical protein